MPEMDAVLSAELPVMVDDRIVDCAPLRDATPPPKELAEVVVTLLP